VFIQSFEPDSLRLLRGKTSVSLIQLTSDASMLDAAGLKRIAGYADGIGPEKRLLVPIAPDGSVGAPTDLVQRAHAAGLVVHIWTIRVDRQFLPAGYHGRGEAEFEQFRDLGVDGIFTDFPDAAAKALRNTPPR
jgi:glycerophosphoryl diester phosphodiesterase